MSEQTGSRIGVVERLRAAEVIAPADHSITRFVPFVQIDAATRDEAVAEIERLREALKAARRGEPGWSFVVDRALGEEDARAL